MTTEASLGCFFMYVLVLLAGGSVPKLGKVDKK